MFNRLKIGKKVAVLRFNVSKNRDKFEVGKIIGIREIDDGTKQVVLEYSDGTKGLHYEFELFKKWDKSYEK